MREWALGLDGLSGGQIKAGLEKCLKRELAPGEQDWPPTPAEFRSMCSLERIPACHRDAIQLPKPKQDTAKIEYAISAMREKLKMDEE